MAIEKLTSKDTDWIRSIRKLQKLNFIMVVLAFLMVIMIVAARLIVHFKNMDIDLNEMYRWFLPLLFIGSFFYNVYAMNKRFLRIIDALTG